MLPPLCFTIPYTVDSPSPVPLPIGLVVKNGSKTWESVAASIPCPVSLTCSMTYRPGPSSRSRPASSPTSTFDVSIVILPPCGMASRAFTARFISTCSTCPGSAFTGTSDGCRLAINSISSPITRDSFIQIQNFRLQHLFPAESQQLVRQRRRPVRRPSNLLQPVARSLVISQPSQQQLAMTHNDAQNIVEVVRHAARQPSDRLQLLRVPQLFFQMHARGHVPRNTPGPHPMSVDHGSHHGVAKNLFFPLGVHFARFLVGDPVTGADEILHEFPRDWIVEHQKVRQRLPPQIPRRRTSVHSRERVIAFR